MSGLADVERAIRRAEADYNRPRDSVRLIAVSKTYGADAIRPLLDAGQRRFGENRVQEAQAKWPALRSAAPDLDLHLIGPLQSNKTRDAMALFDAIHSLDRPKLARAIAEEAARIGRCPDLFVQVNTGAEPQKAGILPADADGFVAECRDVLGLPVVGLMCIPPIGLPPSPHFAMLAMLAQRNGLSCLSMGMSADFEAAIQLGATHVRVGSAIFGERRSSGATVPG